ncbi:hypothetical protein F5J12DRAFT_852712 [Pisolithus orientalis]|uniref:uncharacterized protein n=1 Tax=Pisolithus orientalis TaxID=936130 RepID=UPI0022252215|nr:uncharacterized protein F5J12DRAFT_852712 [Pisolithus orientalis]KAI5996875.1 hypothetical protein F5J12DRAFT_852712 [Pisolithus orientalis]
MGIPGGFGVALVGGLVSAALYGITILQTYVYFMHCSEDALITKLLVAATWILDTLHMSLMGHLLYYYLITNYGVPTSLKYIVWSYPVSLLVNVLVVVVVQLFFAHKIYCLCRPQLKWLLTTLVILLVLIRFVGGMGLGAVMFVHNEATIFTQIRFSVIIPTGTTFILSEGLITMLLCVLLYGGSRDGLPRTKRLLNTLIVYAVNRCLLTLLVAIAMFSMTVEVQDSWSMGLDFIIGRLYTNSLLASLNARQYLRSQNPETAVHLHMNAIDFADPQKLSGQGESQKDGEVPASSMAFASRDSELAEVDVDPGQGIAEEIWMAREEMETECRGR